ncbi:MULTISPECIES: GNAT family N-acetyltransferase [Fusobacterium]|jgi:toxin-antitoxin system, toxin component, GNAT family|uniref:N-acetyltransferase n=3 Tax=Fusobacterium nucleatum subsp. polymorphum TaxID=76857 RepID=A0A2C6C580_FUSNP|nr:MULTISPECIES: GNAT family N-acetyltransferase [Fusobacterium]EUB27038.1 acetyltransferase (GNAT) domain protein [Fusobacterium sp. CM22]PHI13946.1 N-acetyltransferase [Fusobacterium polymorphum]BEO91626.1 hypothetical protein FNCP4_08380 [Fusobacterium nucleatum]BEP03701.1 hypothetical protein FNSP4_14350 [Fusobacterium nucleatum]
MNKIKRIKIIELENYQEVIKEFSCGATELDEYLKKKAYTDMLKTKTVTYLLFRNDELFGFYTLNLYQIEEDKPNNDGDKESLNYLELKYLGIHSNFQNKGLGSVIIKEIIIPEVKEYFNFLNLIRGLFTTPLNNRARTFYYKFGFENLKFVIDDAGEEIEYLWIDFLSKK